MDGDREEERNDTRSAPRLVRNGVSKKNVDKHDVVWGEKGETITTPLKPFKKQGTEVVCNLVPGNAASLADKIAYCVNVYLTEEMLETTVIESNAYAALQAGAVQYKKWAHDLVRQPVTEHEVIGYVGTRLAHALRGSASASELYSRKFPHHVKEGDFPLSRNRFHLIASTLHCQAESSSVNPLVGGSSKPCPVGTTKIGKLFSKCFKMH
jgi:hypothetical protein